MRTGLGLGLVSLMLATGSAAALDPAGNAVAVIQEASADLSGQTLVLNPGDALFMGQTVITGPGGQVQVVFNDNTHLVVGPGSSLVIAEYLMRNDQTASKFVIDALSGTFRFVTGNSPKNAYEIKTPTGTIGVRGTAFDLGIDPITRETSLLLYHGGVDLCAIGARCVTMSDTCGLGLIPNRDLPEILKAKDKRQASIKSAFPYLDSQIPLRRDFRISGIAKCRSVAPIEVAETLEQCPAGYSGTFPDCVPPACPSGYSGTYPNCEPPPPPSCPSGYSGTYPDCQPPACPSGYTGTYPNCEPPPPPSCPSGYSGTYPNCVPPPPPDDEDDEGDDDHEHNNGHGHENHNGNGWGHHGGHH